MKMVIAYLTRFVLCGVGLALVFLFCYRGQPPEDDTLASYLVTCGLLSLIGILGYLLRIRRSRPWGVFSAAGVGFVVSFALINLSGAYGPVNGMPWQYFYKDDGVFAFMLIAPVSLAFLTGILTLIPEQKGTS